MKMKLLIRTMLIPALFFGLAGNFLQAQVKPNQNDVTTAASDAELVSKIINGNEKEIALAKLAIEKSQDDDIKSIAHELITDHSEMLKELRSLDVAEGQEPVETQNDDLSGVNQSQPGDTGTASNQLDIAGNKTSETPDSQEVAKEDAMAAQTGSSASSDIPAPLQSASGEEFDALWAAQMLINHKIKLGDLHVARKNASDPQLKEIASEAIPKVREHRDKLSEIVNPSQASINTEMP